MKNLIFTIILLFFTITDFAQNIGINYYSTGAGRNITLAYSKILNKNEFGVGLGFNIGSIKQPDDQDNIYYKRLYPTKLIHYLNFNTYYDYNFLNNSSCIKPLLFFDLQVKYSTTRSSMYIIYDYDSTIIANTPEEHLLYRNFIEYFGPFLWVENSLGIGFKVDLNKNVYIKQTFGLGINFIFGSDPRLAKTNPDFEFCGLINFGIGIRLNTKST